MLLFSELGGNYIVCFSFVAWHQSENLAWNKILVSSRTKCIFHTSCFACILVTEDHSNIISNSWTALILHITNCNVLNRTHWHRCLLFNVSMEHGTNVLFMSASSGFLTWNDRQATVLCFYCVLQRPTQVQHPDA